MTKKKLLPFSKEVVDACAERIRKMSPAEAMEFLMYRTPGIEETDTTGMLPVDGDSRLNMLDKELVAVGRK